MRIFIIVILILIIITGCEVNYNSLEDTDDVINYSFENPDIVAYINGRPIYMKQMSAYIDMKTKYNKLIYSNGSEPIFSYDEARSDDIYYIGTYVVKLIGYKIDYLRSEKLIKFIDAELRRDYYKNVIYLDYIRKNEIENWDSIVFQGDKIIQRARDRDFKVSLDDCQEINIVSIIDDVAKDYNMTYKECVDTVFAEFWRYELAYKYRLSIFGDKYKGERIKFDGTNEKEFIQFLMDVYDQYEEYIDMLFEKSEIIERT